MNFRRLEILSNEVEIINAIIAKKDTVSFESLFEYQEDLTKELKLDKICEIIYKVFKTAPLEDESALLKMFENYYGEDSKIGNFCIDFIKMNLELSEMTLEERLVKLLEMDCECLPNAQIKIDYLQMTLSLLLNQEPLNLERINEYNNKLKELLYSVQDIRTNEGE
jgi:hypothetical protein